MANLIITNNCNADCGFCFAAASRSGMIRADHRQMDEADFRSWMAFLSRSGIREVRLLGGEPTLHPDFPRFVSMARDAGFTVVVFTNGVMPARALDALAGIPEDACSVVVNLSAAIRAADGQRQAFTLEKLGPRVTPGLTLTSPDLSFVPAVGLIHTFGLRKSIRLGLSNPTWGGTNQSLHPKRYPAVGKALLEQSFLTARHGIALEADCGFVRCMFGDQFDRLCENGFRYVSRCTPVLDCCPGGTILPCFGLSQKLTVSRDDLPDARAVYKRFVQKLKPFRAAGVYPECGECPYFRTSECCGGCLAARLRRFQPLDQEVL